MVQNDFYDAFKASLSDPTFDRIYVLSHLNPDGDAVGSACALTYLLRLSGKKALYFTETPDHKYAYLSDAWNSDRYGGLFAPEHFITTDTTGFSRLSKLPDGFSHENEFELLLSFVIDHHKCNSFSCTHKLVLSEKAAAGEIIFDLYKNCGIGFDEYSAAAIYTAIATDTGCFRYANTRASSFLCAAELCEFAPGGSFYEINKIHFETKSFKKIKIESYAVENAIFRINGALVFSVFDSSERARLSITDIELEGVVSMLRQIEGVRAAFVLKQQPSGEFKVSVRTDYTAAFGGINAAELCACFSGGGHDAAAGCSLSGAPDEIIDLLESAAVKTMNSKNASV
ncbi:Bifunctional oligoribonuclease and PAP phosphatase NrnA [bioreactor metagenome]|uniref:Bifunctional oligoribonuclease and PAP phosphatase NrnA n=1 Tax=bioreactor metagenome TaxID=1076179 RepID=A0A645AFW1_9ZZZZ|nr:DHH family phosphoesterase [Oscillospiraceae bacterium]